VAGMILEGECVDLSLAAAGLVVHNYEPRRMLASKKTLSAP
jgi:hypothetical protein